MHGNDRYPIKRKGITGSRPFEDYAPWLWGWPNRFLQRMEAVGSRVFVIGDYDSVGYTQGFDDPDRLKELPADFSRGIWTDRIDIIGPAVAKETEE